MSDDADFRFRDVALTAFGPTIVNGIGHGAVMPVLALQARHLGADVSTAALVVALLGIGSLLASLPAGSLVARIGERRTLIIAGLVDAAVMAAAALADSVVGLGVAVLVSGMTWTAFLMARQGYMIDAVPGHLRARGMSALGGSMRVGVLVGPLIGAALIGLGGVPAVFWLAAAMSAASAALAFLVPDLSSPRRDPATRRSVADVLMENRRVLLTLGVGVVVIAASRSVRTALMPLWADHVGLSAATTSLLFALAAAIDIAFFLPGGWLMDTRGRFAVAVPVVVAASLACLLLPLAHSAWSVGAVMALIALGNGLGSGIVMTLGADAAPADARAQFLGAWRLCGDLGNSGGPAVVAVLATLAPLAVASMLVGGVLAAGAVWVGKYTRHVDRERAAINRS